MRQLQLLLAALLIAATAAAEPVVTVEKGRLVATGVTAGGDVLWFSQAHERPFVYVRLVNRTEIVSDSDRDGRVEYLLPQGTAPRAVWVAVDLPTGGVGIGQPSGAVKAVRSLSPEMLSRQGTQVVAIELPQPLVQFLLVRPGVGYWTARTGEANPGCGAPKKPGRSTICLAELHPGGDSPAQPVALAPGDVVLAIDPLDLTCYHGVYGTTF